MLFDAYRLKIPLIRPYRLAFGMVHHYDTVLVRCTIGREQGWGEATLLTGYTDETIEDAWEQARLLAMTLAEATPANARTHLLGLQARHPFIATAFFTAMEMAQKTPMLCS